MKLVSWNLNGLDDQYIDERTEAAMFQMLLGAPIEKAMQPDFKPNTPDVILLQEVVSRTYHAHISPHLKAAGFQIFPKRLGERSYFEVIAVRQPVIDYQYTAFSYTSQGRGLSTIILDDLSIMTAHMESQKPGKSMRLDQANEILTIMNDSKTPCLFAGDTNLRKSEWKSLSSEAVKDAWEAIGSPPEHKVTWKNEPYKARYDRIWIYKLNVDTFETFGNNKVASINQPSSDHLGLRLNFSLVKD
jgi:endonuclease/exonuclease/phosphatase family metal-dependent hydrolase